MAVSLNKANALVWRHLPLNRPRNDLSMNRRTARIWRCDQAFAVCCSQAAILHRPKRA
jgi:hypothetical protein